MQFTYGNGKFIEGQTILDGEIILSEHKLFLKNSEGDLARTYIPLEKIDHMKITAQGLIVHVRATVSFDYWATFSGRATKIVELAKDIAESRGMKKRFLRNEWDEVII